MIPFSISPFVFVDAFWPITAAQAPKKRPQMSMTFGEGLQRNVMDCCSDGVKVGVLI